MSAKFSFAVDPARSLVRIRMGGFFTLDDIHAFVDARRDAHRALRCAANAHITFNDIRAMKIQSQEIVDAFREMLSAPEYISRRLAFLVSPTLARTQVARALADRDAQCFENGSSALAWLLAPERERPSEKPSLADRFPVFQRQLGV